MQDDMRYERILNTLSESVLTLARDWNVACFNQAAEKMLGIERRAVIGRKFQ